MLKDYLEYQGYNNISGSRDAFREAFAANLITDRDGWMDMLKSRNLTSHSYNQGTADEISTAVVNKYYYFFIALEERFNDL